MEDSIFEEIYQATARPLWAYVARISGSRSAADDVLQETYLRFLRSPFEGSDIKEVKPYLYKIATNLVYKRFNQIKSRNETEYISELENEAIDVTNDFRGKIETTQIFSRLKETGTRAFMARLRRGLRASGNCPDFEIEFAERSRAALPGAKKTRRIAERRE